MSYPNVSPYVLSVGPRCSPTGPGTRRRTSPSSHRTSAPQVAAVTAIGNQARAAAGKGPIGDLNAAIYSPSFNRSAAFSGFVTPDPVPGYPTTAGYDLTTGWGSRYAPAM